MPNCAVARKACCRSAKAGFCAPSKSTTPFWWIGGWRARVAAVPARPHAELLQRPVDRARQPRLRRVDAEVVAHEVALERVGAALLLGPVAVGLGAELADHQRLRRVAGAQRRRGTRESSSRSAIAAVGARVPAEVVVDAEHVERAVLLLAADRRRGREGQRDGPRRVERLRGARWRARCRRPGSGRAARSARCRSTTAGSTGGCGWRSTLSSSTLDRGVADRRSSRAPRCRPGRRGSPTRRAARARRRARACTGAAGSARGSASRRARAPSRAAGRACGCRSRSRASRESSCRPTPRTSSGRPLTSSRPSAPTLAPTRTPTRRV